MLLTAQHARCFRVAASARSFSNKAPLGDATHAVFNQVPPLGNLDGYNLFTSDAALRETVDRHGGGWAEAKLRVRGAELGSAESWALGEAANRHVPTLRTHDANGNRVDQVEYHPAYHQLMASGVSSGACSLAWTHPTGTPGAHVARAALMYMQNQPEPGHCCPLVMTFAAVPAIRASAAAAATATAAGQGNKGWHGQWEAALTSGEYDGRDLPLHLKRGATVGMSMTEKQGGSDVQTNTTTARELPKGSFQNDEQGNSDTLYELTGHKWFTSAPMSDGFLTLARLEDGSSSDASPSSSSSSSPQRLSCFLVPRWLPNGSKNHGLQFQRLKDKMGDKANASSEVEYRGAAGYLVGSPGRGINAILEMVHHTRLDCALGSAAGIRRCVAVAANHTRVRSAFGQTLQQQPLMQQVLVDLMVESEAATQLALRTAASFDHAAGAGNSSSGSGGGQHLDDPAAFSRLATAVTKYFVCKQYPLVAYEALECLGGNGYVEDFPMARLYRQAPLNAVWEGSGNVLALDVLRTLAKVPSAVHSFMQELHLSQGLDSRADAHVLELKQQLKWLASEASPVEQQAAARGLVVNLARAFQASTLLQHAAGTSSSVSGNNHSNNSGAAHAAALFCAAKLGSSNTSRVHYGTLPLGCQETSPQALNAILDRHTP